jgi:hypothetical protein
MGLMKNRNTTRELGLAIGALVGSYMDGLRDAAQRAVKNALGRSEKGGRRTDGRRRVEASSTMRASRRTAAQLAETCDTISDAIRAQPGIARVGLAERMGVDATTLSRPIALLKSTGRVRSVGQRRLARYYPAVMRASAGKE